MKKRRIWVRRVLWALLAIVVVSSILHVTERYWLKDFGGMTRNQVEELSIEDQYGLLSDRFDVMLNLLEQAQRPLHDGEWRVGDYGRITAGHYSPTSLTGMNSRNSYFVQTARVWDSPNTGNSTADLLPLEELFREQGWRYRYAEVEMLSGTMHVIRAEVGDGWRIVCRVDSSGQFILEVMSGSFWADALAVKFALHNRVADLGPDHAPPGVIPEFPAWDAPLKPPSERL